MQKSTLFDIIESGTACEKDALFCLLGVILWL